MRKSTKQTLRALFDRSREAVACLFSIPIAVLYFLLYKCHIVNHKTAAIMASRWYGDLGIHLRRWFYKWTLASCGPMLKVHYGAYIVYPDVEIGRRCTIEDYSIVSRCKIGNDVIIAARVSIMSGAHHHDVDKIDCSLYDAGGVVRQLILGDDLWIGTHAVVMSDVSAHTVVGAGAVVTHNFPEYSVIAGVPARLVRKRGQKQA